MSDLGKILFKRIAGKSLDDFQAPTHEAIRRQVKEQLQSKYVLRELGTSTDGKEWLSEEQRVNHIHILGAPNEGKSKFIEHLIKQDIDRGYGACLLDPTKGGHTAYALLRYCCKKKIEKICFIDPHHRYSQEFEHEGKTYGWGPIVAGINPITNAPSEIVAEKLLDVSRILWEEEASKTGNIETYFPALIRILAKTHQTLAELDYFLTTDRYSQFVRDEIFNIRKSPDDKFPLLSPANLDRRLITQAFEDKGIYKQEYRSTMRRFLPFLQHTLKVMFGSKDAIDFQKMISEGWVILVNLDPMGIWGEKHSRLLGTVIINELISAIDRLQTRYKVKPYYLYIDEVGHFATPKLQWLLDYGRHLNLRVVMAHQGFDQVHDRDVRASIMRSAKTKVLFHCKNTGDQKEMLQMMFHGKLAQDARVAVMKLGQGKAIVALDKKDPFVLHVKDTPDTEVSPEELDHYFNHIIYAQPWYHKPEDVLQEINARFKPEEPSVRGRRPNQKTTIGEQERETRTPKNSRSFRTRTIHDNRSNSPSVLRPTQGRATRKILYPKTEKE